MSNEQIIKQYLKYLLEVKKVRNKTIELEKWILKSFNEHIKDKNFEKVIEQEILDYLKTYSISAYDDRLRKLKKFYNWLFKLPKSQYPECISRIQPNYKNPIQMYRQSPRYRERVVSEEEYQRMLDCTYKVMHKAMLETLYLFGCRASELLSMNSNSVVYDGEFTKVFFPQSKGQPRDNSYYGRAEHLLKWVESYQPFKNESNKPLWITSTYTDKKTKKVYHNTRTTINGLEKSFRVISKRAGLRNITPHDFRHTRITNERKNGTPNTHIENQLGLSHNSAMMEVYDHNKTKGYEEYLKQKRKETPATHELLMKQKEILELKHEKEINELNNKFEGIFKLLKTTSKLQDLDDKIIESLEDENSEKTNLIIKMFKQK
ncbi:MAG: tyrosine-type recombinase/integrase [Candidatus Thermoplasmatota archaeon]|nr:tyrosine-type recombinase/integrase [Candidatus Thermoplasmatota archaeon]